MWGRRKKAGAGAAAEDLRASRDAVEPPSPVLDARIVETTRLFLQRLSQGSYDFVDLGTCEGGGFEIAARLGGKRGLGFDIDPSLVASGLDRGLDVACHDIRALKTDAAKVDFAVCSHILEHLPDVAAVTSVIDASARLARDYILIFGPCFDEEDYLSSLGVKLLHSLMLDHTCKFKVVELIAILHALDLRDYVIGLTERIEDSSNHWIYARDQPVSANALWTYDATRHSPKPHVVFDREVYRDFVCVVPLRDGIDTDAVLRDFRWGYEKIAFQSSWRLFGTPGRPR